MTRVESAFPSLALRTFSQNEIPAYRPISSAEKALSSRNFPPPRERVLPDIYTGNYRYGIFTISFRFARSLTLRNWYIITGSVLAASAAKKGGISLLTIPAVVLERRGYRPAFAVAKAFALREILILSAIRISVQNRTNIVISREHILFGTIFSISRESVSYGTIGS